MSDDIAARYETLFAELRHRVKNHLTMVSAALQLQAHRAEPQVREPLMSAAGRVQSIAETHDALYADGDADEIDLGGYLTRLCARLADALLETERVSIEVEAPVMRIAAGRAAPLGMIVNELVTNAAKYAFPPPLTGAIRVRLHQEADGVILTVSDSGCGLPEGFDSGTGLGMTIIRSLTKQLGGTLSIERTPATVFRLWAPAQV